MRFMDEHPPSISMRAAVYCPICTHTVEAAIVTTRKRTFVKPGQQCSRCASSLDAAYVLGKDRAA